ncbi:DUF6702 family protein [Flavobacterium sp.]|jgi:hypothetical protein|uniref:DUF6702 family protein n=1 Tax=Flavobacterium sp. TaxID=239 RepID=UPI002A8381CF|nr:DUF6702 family protein [Flavobacterium sp.]
MKNKYKITLLLAVFTLMSSFAIHKFYVSVTQIDFVPKKQRIEITSRIFIDDFEKVLKKKYDKNFYLSTNKEIAEADSYIQKYLEEKIKLTINNKSHKVIFITKEVEDDVLICYLKVQFSEKITTFEIFNSVLTEMFSEQKNIVHTDINGNKKSVLLTYSERSTLLEF